MFYSTGFDWYHLNHARTPRSYVPPNGGPSHDDVGDYALRFLRVGTGTIRASAKSECYNEQSPQTSSAKTKLALLSDFSVCWLHESNSPVLNKTKQNKKKEPLDKDGVAAMNSLPSTYTERNALLPRLNT
jgi:hypothetical protein